MAIKKTVFILIGTRPNFIKVTQFKKCALLFPLLEIVIIHTGQHYDEKMADVFFRQFNLEPDHFLNIAPGTPNSQIAEILIKLEQLCGRIGKPDILLVPGDVNSTLAGALFANKMGIHLGHIEAGLRSFDRKMPEEFNRVITDQLCDLFFVTEPSAIQHLMNEKKDKSRIHFVGNTMIDTMIAFDKEIESSTILTDLAINEDTFILMTMHRPATVDQREGLEKLIALIASLGKQYNIVFPVHPRTIQHLKTEKLYQSLKVSPNLLLIEPLDYFSFQKLIKTCAFIITDSGGIQEESTYRQKPCLTLRPNTERPVTIDVGTNTLLPFDLGPIQETIQMIQTNNYKKGAVPELWDGKATSRILRVLQEYLI